MYSMLLMLVYTAMGALIIRLNNYQNTRLLAKVMEYSELMSMSVTIRFDKLLAEFSYSDL